MIETLWPVRIDKEKGQEENENCSVFMIHYGDYRIMITGDLDSAGEKQMIDYYSRRNSLEKLDADILKVGHHGSKTSTSDEFLDAVTPEYAVIQVGKNSYGHPNDETLLRLEKHGITVLRNDLNGAVGFSLKKKIKCHVVISDKVGYN